MIVSGQPHEGSGYASQKVLQMAWHRLEHARSRVNELERIKTKHTGNRPTARPASATSGSSGTAPAAPSTTVPQPAMPGASGASTTTG
jgi:mediator of RNA polymerase II transcription subunit 11